MEESSATVLMAEMNSSTDVGAVDDRRKKTPPYNCVTPFDPNETLQSEKIQFENEEDNEVNNYLLSCANLAEFESKFNTHFITYFKQQNVDTRLCGLHSLNNAKNKRAFK
eukprot:3918972-Ditylum_brightwellii.AAC.1